MKRKRRKEMEKVKKIQIIITKWALLCIYNRRPAAAGGSDPSAEKKSGPKK
ncbi:hypothetical protein QG37_06719 [Candidozyma auris]|uniref:Uncharacterized protein n=1 Tax=Candidozyma auris TaxID=498019 RepID=A0A0L0NT48_CANAR|nr:hypothetical protein QG37_06719 [[Candida] auris]